MIYSSQFIWLHLPRSGGTATANWMREMREVLRPPIAIDPDTDSAKHDNLLTRALRRPGDINPLLDRHQVPVCINFKRLPSWLRSMYLFMKHLGFDVEEERYMRGEFFSLRVGQWCPADWWIDYFDFDQIDHLFRSDQLEDDWNSFFSKVTCTVLPRVIFKEANQVGCPSMLSVKCSTCDWKSAYQRNPQWTAIERKAYGI